MKAALPYALVVLVMLALLAGANFTYPEFCKEQGLDFWNVVHLNRRIEDEGKEMAQIDARSEVLMQSIHAKQWIVAELAAGRMSLIEAVEHFRASWADRPLPLHIWRKRFPGKTDDELYVLAVFRHVQSQFQDRPEILQPTLARLQAEWAGLQEQENGHRDH